MRNIAIVGASQAGIMLAFALKHKQYDVTLYSNRTAEQILKGQIMPSQGMFDSALQIERKLGLNFWDSQCPWNSSVTFTLSIQGLAQKGIEWKGKTKKPFQAIDQRLKFSYWLKEFKRIGGNTIIQDIDLNELNHIANQHELIIVAGENAEINHLFPRDNERSDYNSPTRTLACFYIKGTQSIKNNPGIRGNIIPDVGEYFTMPGLTLNGHCEMMLFEGIPGGPFDCWDELTNPDEQLKLALKLLKDYIPWEAEKCENLYLTDNKATFISHHAPIIRQPVAKLASGKLVLGIAETVVFNNPITGQAANNAAICADIYSNKIIERGNLPFDKNWMQETFQTYWQQVGDTATQWSTLLLLPPPQHIIELLTIASSIPLLADKLANGFNEPSSLFPWITDPAATKTLMEALLIEEAMTSNMH